jgi:hypothetical protein
MTYALDLGLMIAQSHKVTLSLFAKVYDQSERALLDDMLQI